MFSKKASLIGIAVGSVLFLAGSSGQAQPGLPSPDAKLCKVLPAADIEAAL